MKLPNATAEIAGWIIENEGFENWVNFCSTFGGQHWWIPTTPAKIARDDEIKHMYVRLTDNPGMKAQAVYKKLSLRFGLSETTIRRILL